MKPTRPSDKADPGYVSAFTALMKKLESAFGEPRKPITVCLGGGAAMHLYTGSRVSKDVDAKVMARFIAPENLDVAYRDRDGNARLIYFDRQYNDTFGLLHRDAYEDAAPLCLDGLDPRRIDLRILTPLDLAVSKLARYETQDQDDIAELARAGLIDAGALRQRAEEALPDYVGNLDRVRNSIDLAEKRVNEAGSASSRRS